MFCHQCGKKLRANARFCFNCGTPVRESSERSEPAGACTSAALTEIPAGGPQLPHTPTDSAVDASRPPASQPDATGLIPQEPSTQTESPTPVNHVQNTLPEISDNSAADARPKLTETSETGTPPKNTDAKAAPDLILKKGNVIVSGRELHLKDKYYSKKTGRKKFKKRKDNSHIPFEAIIGISVEHKKYGGRIFLSLLLFACFVAGVLFSADYGYSTYNEWNTPYRHRELTTLENVMDLIDNSGMEKLQQYRNKQEENLLDTSDLVTKLSELEAQQSREILAAVYNSDRFDLDTFFNNKFFADAYREYLQDLLNVFKGDELLHSWLYNYYETVKVYGGNYFLDTDIWIYDGSGENQFSSVLDSVNNLTQNQYDLDFYEHMLYTKHIYITASDFMEKVLSLPRYTVDGAVFVNAFGGVPEPAEMSVPGWSRSHYEEFWLYGADYYNVDTPMWLDYGLTARDFDLNWNSLANETAYYNAYKEFMGKIAPGLPCYDIAVYHADDTAFGGMGFRLSGTEASISDLTASYAENHPEFIEELKKSGIYNDSLTTSVDEDINEITQQLGELEQEYEKLETQINTLEQTLADADIYRSQYQALLTDIEQHAQELLCRLLFLCGTLLFCTLAALICLCKFIGFFKRPRHLFVIKRQDMEFAFNIRRCPKEQIAALQDRLTKPEDLF